MAKKNKVHVVSWETESGDSGVIAFLEKPTDNHLETYFREDMPDEFDDEYNSRTIFWDVETLNLMPLPAPADKVTPSI